MKNNLWIIGICNSESDGVELRQVIGTADDIKMYLCKQLLSDKENNEEGYDYGTESTDEISVEYVADEEKSDETIIRLDAYATYSDYHIDYTACRSASLKPDYCCKGKMIHTNIGKMPLEDYLDIRASEYGYDSYEELKAAGYYIEIAEEDIEEE